MIVGLVLRKIVRDWILHTLVHHLQNESDSSQPNGACLIKIGSGCFEHLGLVVTKKLLFDLSETFIQPRAQVVGALLHLLFGGQILAFGGFIELEKWDVLDLVDLVVEKLAEEAKIQITNKNYHTYRYISTIIVRVIFLI